MSYKNKTKDQLIKELELLVKLNKKIDNAATAKDKPGKDILESEEKYRRIFDLVSDSIFLVESESGKILETNLAATTLYGYSIEEFLNLSIDAITAQPGMSLNSIKEEELFLPLRYHKKKDGTIFPVEITVRHFKSHGKKMHVSSVRDISNRLKMEDELENQQGLLKNVINSSPNFIYVKNLEGKFVLINKVALEMLGLSQEQVIGKTVFDIFKDKQIAQIMHEDDISIVSEEKGSVEREEQYLNKDGNLGWVFTVKRPLKDKYGKIRNLIGISIDITERIEAEKVLQEREQNYKLLIDSSIDPIYVMQDRRLVLVSKAWEDLFEYSADEVLSTEFDIYKIVAPESRDFIANRFATASQRKSQYSGYEFKGLSKSGNILNLEARVSKITWNGKPAFQGVYRNISDMKRTEEALRREAFIFENLYDAVIITDMQGQILNWNHAAEKLYGYSKNEILNKSTEIINKRVSAIPLTEQIIQTIKEKGKWTGEINYIRKDGTIGISESIVTPYIDGEDNQIALVEVNRDITQRKLAEEALRESEEKFRKLAEKSLVGIYLIQDGIFQYLNPKFAEIFGYSVNELVNVKGPTDITRPDSAKTVEENIAKRISGQIESMHYEFEGLRKDGNFINVEVFGSRANYKGRPAIIGTLLEITERKKADEELKEGRRRYKELTDLLPQTIFEMNNEGILTFMNQSAFKMLRYTPEDFKRGISIYDCLVPKDREEARLLIQKMFKQENKQGTEYAALRKDGTTFPIIIFFSPILKEEKVIGRRGILIDITERKKYEEELRKLSRAVEQSSNSIIITDRTGNIEYVNPWFTKLTGYTFDEVKGKNPRILKSGYSEADVYKSLWDTIISGKTWRGEFHNLKKNGEFYWESTSISPIVNTEGEITHFIAIKEDITEKKLIHEELIKSKEKAEESNRLKSEFLAQMSHEIRSPLNVILSYNSYLKEELENKIEGELNTVFPAIDSAGKRLLRTIELILNMAAAQSGSLDLSLTMVDLALILKGLVKEFEYTAKTKGLVLNLILKSQEAKIFTDEYIVSEIFQNLIHNAIKYTQSGKVEVILYVNDNKKLCVDVADTGIGISKNYLPFLFQTFTQEDAGYSRKFEGNGLGLALVKKYIEILDEKIEVKTKQGKGSVFTVIFENSSRKEN